MEVLTESRDYLYKQVQAWLKQQIRAGKLKPGGRLPGERLLAQSLKLSRYTIKTALEELEKDGFIERIPSRGAFIKKAGEQRQLKLALIFPEPEISRAQLSYASWMTIWAKQQGLLNSCAKHHAHLSFMYCNPEECSGLPGKIYVEQYCEKLSVEFDGAFFPGPQLSELKQSLIERNFPLFNLNEFILLPEEKGITYNREEICKKAAELLLQRGCRRIKMLIHGFHKDKFWKPKYHSVREALVSSGIDFSESDVLQVGSREEEVYLNLKSYYKNREALPDAFFGTTQTHAMGLIRLAGEMGWKIPDDFYIMGYANTSESLRDTIVREISYISLPYLEMGSIAADLLIERITSGREIPKMTEVPAELITEGKNVFSE